MTLIINLRNEHFAPRARTSREIFRQAETAIHSRSILFLHISMYRVRDTRQRGRLSIGSLEWTIVGHRCNAKYTWKRIPPDMKAAHEELGRVWTVGQCMWQRNWPAVHAALNVEWSEDIRDVMTALKGKSIRQSNKLTADKCFVHLDRISDN